MYQIPVQRAKIRRAHHCLVPRNKTYVKDVQKITLLRPVNINFHFQTVPDTLEEDAWLLRRNPSTELAHIEMHACSVLNFKAAALPTRKAGTYPSFPVLAAGHIGWWLRSVEPNTKVTTQMPKLENSGVTFKRDEHQRKWCQFPFPRMLMN